MDFQGAVEEEVSEAHCDVIDDLRSFSQVGKPYSVRILDLEEGLVTYQVITWADEDPSARKERKGKIIVMLQLGVSLMRRHESGE